MIIIFVIYIAFILFIEYRILMGYRFTHPAKTIAWMLSILFIPVIGVVLYAVFGRDKRHYKEDDEREEWRIEENRKEKKADTSLKNFQNLITNLSSFPVCTANQVELLPGGESTFNNLFEDIKPATKSIYILYYEIADDELGLRLKKLLIDKAHEGVEIKIIYDSFGSKDTGSRFFDEMREQGIEVKEFSPLSFPRLLKSGNYRNHRKLVVIDSKIAYAGGINVSKIYITGGKYGIWRDFHLKITGEAITDFIQVFGQDWQRVTGTNLLPDNLSQSLSATPGIDMQVLASEPESTFAKNKLMMDKVINLARESIWIETPYLSLPVGILDALKAAALSGIDVRIVVPRQADKPVLSWTSRSYFAQLLSCGIQVYWYLPGMLHSKLILIDRHITIAGSSNMDIRSLTLNYELNVILYNDEINRQIREIICSDMEDCEHVDPKKWKHRSRTDKFKEALARLVAPLI